MRHRILVVLALAGAFAATATVSAGPAEAYFAQKGVYGTAGTGPGQFNGITAIATDRTGSFYVLDSGGRVQRFDGDGRLVASFGDTDATPSAAPGDFHTPLDLAVDSAGDVYVADSTNARVQKFGPDGTLLDADWGQTGAVGITVDATDTVYVSTTEVKRYTTAGALIDRWGAQPGKIAVDQQGFVYISKTGGSQVLKYDSAGSLVGRIGSAQAGVDPGEFSAEGGPQGLTVDAAGSIWVADPYHYRIQQFSTAGSLTAVCAPDFATDQSFAAADAATGSNGDIYVAAGSTVWRFGEDGPPAPRCDSLAPRLRSFAIDPERFSVPARPSGRRGGATVRYEASEAGTSSMRIERYDRGRRVRGRCRPATRANRDAPRCARWRGQGRIERDSAAGEVAWRFSGWIGRDPLRRGLYRAELRLTDAAGNRSRVATERFRVR